MLTWRTACRGWRVEEGWRGDCGVDEPEVTDFGPVAARQLDTITWRGYLVRVPPLALQLQVSERRGLTDRADKIRRALGQAPSTSPTQSG